MRKMEENMGIFKDDEEKTTENVSLPEDLNLDDIGDDLGSLFDEDKTCLLYTSILPMRSLF